MKKYFFIPILLLVTVGLLMTGCKDNGAGSPVTADPEPVVLLDLAEIYEDKDGVFADVLTAINATAESASESSPVGALGETSKVGISIKASAAGGGLKIDVSSLPLEEDDVIEISGKTAEKGWYVDLNPTITVAAGDPIPSWKKLGGKDIAEGDFTLTYTLTEDDIVTLGSSSNDSIKLTAPKADAVITIYSLTITR